MRRALVAVDRAPRVERTALMVHLARMDSSPIERAQTPQQARLHQRRIDQRERRQHEGLRIPEHVALVAFAGQALRGDATLTIAPGRLEHVEQVESESLFAGLVAVDREDGSPPECGELACLRLQQSLEAGLDGELEHGRGAGMQRVRRYRLPRLIPRISDVFLDRDALAGLDVPGVGLADAVRCGRSAGKGQPTDLVTLHADQADRTFPGALLEPCLALGGNYPFHLQGDAAAGTEARILPLRGRTAAAGDRRFESDRAGVVDRAQAQANGQQAGPRERYDTLGIQLEGVPLVGSPAQMTRQPAFAQIEHPTEGKDFTLGRIELALSQPHADGSRVSDRHAGVRGSCEAEVTLVVVDRRTLPHPGQKTCLGRTGGLLETAAHTQRTIGQGKQGFVARGVHRLPLRLGQLPGTVSCRGRARQLLRASEILALDGPCLNLGMIRTHAHMPARRARAGSARPCVDADTNDERSWINNSPPQWCAGAGTPATCSSRP